MSRSYLKFGVAVLLAGCAGLAYSQFPSAGSQAPKAERVLTVHENGKANRCRLIASWTTPEGSKAYQLQSLETGELMTMTEEGPSAQVQGSAKSKAVPMKIFHFGKSKAPPAGAPIPPAHVLRDPVYQSAMSASQPAPTQTIVQTGHHVVPSSTVQKVVPSTAGGQIVAMPTATAPSLPTQQMPTQPIDSKVVSSRVLGDEKVVYWDERTGSPERPQGAFNPGTQKGPWDQAPVVVNVQPQTPATSYPTQMPKTPQTFAQAPPTQPGFTPPTISTGNNTNWTPTPTKMPSAPIQASKAPTFTPSVATNTTSPKTGIQQVSGVTPNGTTNNQIVTAQGTNVSPGSGLVQAGGIKTSGSGIQRVSGDAPPSLPPTITAPPPIATPPMISAPPTIATPPTLSTPPAAPALIDTAKPTMSPTQILPPDAPNNTAVSNITAGNAHRAVDMASLGIDPRSVKSFSMYVPSSQVSGGIGTVMTAPGLKAVQGGPTGVIIQADGDLPYTKIMSNSSTGGFGGSIPCQSCMVGSASGVGSIQSGKGRTIILHEGVPVTSAPTHRPLLSKIFSPKDRTASLPKSKSPDSLPEITRIDPLVKGDLGSKTDSSSKTEFPRMPDTADEGAKKIETTKLPETATPASASVPAASNTTNVKTPFSTASTTEQTELRNSVKTADLKKPGEPTKDDPKAGQKRTFRDMWGKLTDNKSHLPGQSTLEQTASNKTFAAPPTSMTEKGKGDVMLSPENLKTPDRGLFKHTPVPPTLPAASVAQAPLTAPPSNIYTEDRTPGAQGVPAGARSVLAARSGVGGPVQFVPVPVVTVPDPIRPPVPPEPKMPEPPQPTAYQNAFTPPQQPVNNVAPQMAPAPLVPPGTLPQMPPAVMGPMLPPQQASMQQQMLNPYQNPYAMQQMAQMQQFLMHQQAMIQQQTMMQQMMMQQSLMAQQQQHGGYHQVGYQPAGYAPMMPPPMQQPMQPQMAPQMQPQNVQPVQYQQPALQPAPASTPTLLPPTSAQPVTPGQGTPTVQQLVSTLLESPYPAQREWAANSLSTQDWKTNPQILHVLSNCAKNDPAASVRAGCVYSMGRMNANSDLVMNTLRHLENDVDPKVRSEVEQARLRLAPR